MLWWIPQVKSCRCAREAKPIHASIPMLASFSIIFHLFLAFHSQSLMTSVLWRPQPPCLPSSGVADQRRPLSGRKQVSCTDRQSCMYGFYTCLICSRGMRAHNWSFILSSKLGKWVFFNVVAVKVEFKSLLFIIQTSLFLPLSSTACLSFFSITTQLVVCIYLGWGGGYYTTAKNWSKFSRMTALNNISVANYFQFSVQNN